MTRSTTAWLPLDIVEGITVQAIREVLEPRFLSGTVAEVTAVVQRRVQELREEMGRLHCDDGPITEDCPLDCLGLPTRQHNAISRIPDAPRTVGQLIAAVRAGRVGEVRNIGPNSEQIVADALRAAGFSGAGGHAHARR